MSYLNQIRSSKNKLDISILIASQILFSLDLIL